MERKAERKILIFPSWNLRSNFFRCDIFITRPVWILLRVRFLHHHGDARMKDDVVELNYWLPLSLESLL
jgi:hypothetical protein